MKYNIFDSLSVLLVKKDEELMKLLVGGNNRAFEALYKKYQAPVLGYLISLTKNKSKAEEIAQDSFFKVYDKRMTFDLKRKFKPWMWQIVRNTSIDFFRKKSDLLFSDIFDEDCTFDDIIGKEDDQCKGNPEVALLKKLDKSLLNNMIQKLKPNQKEILIMSVMSEMSYDEIAQATDRSMSSVKSMLLRARASLNQIIKNENLKGRNE